MRRMGLTCRALLAGVVAFGATGGFLSAAAEDTVEITEWVVPWENTRPRDPYVDAQGRVWFVGQVGNYLAYLDPTSGSFKRYELDEGTGPHNLIVDEAGSVWYAGNRAAHIGRLDPDTGEITKYPMPDVAAADPHTLIFDGNGDIWFTVQRGNFVGKLGTRTGTVELIAVPTAQARPYGIVVDGDNRAWFCELGTNKLATVDPETLELHEVALPRAETRPRRLQAATDGRLWYVDYTGGRLGRLDPSTGEVEEWSVPGGTAARPYGMAIDDQDRLWFVETGSDPNRFVGFDPATETFFSSTEIASGGGSVRHMYFHPPSREIWFGTDTNRIGRARVP
jgi:virginiamycin B lyase